MRLNKLKVIFLMVFAIISVLSNDNYAEKVAKGEYATQEEIAKMREEGGAPSKSNGEELRFLDSNLRNDQSCLKIYWSCSGMLTPCCPGTWCNPYFGFCIFP
jgi:hypothetical protein